MSSGRIEEEAIGDEEEDEDIISDQRDSIEPVPQMPSDEQQQKATSSDQIFSNVTKKRKKRKGLSFNSGSRRAPCSKNMQSLPSFLSDFTWLENTDENCLKLEEERNKILEAKRIKEIERKSKQEQEDNKTVEEEVKVSNAPDVEMIDTSAASPDRSLMQQAKPTSPSVIDFKYESRYDIDSVDDIWQRVEFSYYHSLSDLQRDFETLFMKVLQFRCLNSLAKVYLT